MSAEPAPLRAGDPRPRGVSERLHRRPWLRGLLLLSPPAAWFVALYLAALVALFISAFWQVDDFTGKVVTPGRSTTSTGSSPSPRTARSRCGRSASRRR